MVWNLYQHGLVFRLGRLHQLGQREGIKRSVGNVGQGAIQRQLVLSGFFPQEMKAEWADEIRGESLALRDIAGELGRVHRLGRGEVAILAQVVEQRDRDECEDGDDDADDFRPAAFLQRVNPFLNSLGPGQNPSRWYS